MIVIIVRYRRPIHGEQVWRTGLANLLAKFVPLEYPGSIIMIMKENMYFSTFQTGLSEILSLLYATTRIGLL